MNCNQASVLAQRTTAKHHLIARAGIVIMLTAATPAFAQISKVNTVMSNIQTMLMGASLVITTIAIMWAGFKMMWQHAKWSEISNIVIGAIFVGGCSGIAGWLIN